MLSAVLSGGNVEGLNDRWMWTVAVCIMRFQRGARTWVEASSDLCIENLSEAEYKSNRLICLAEEISRQEVVW